MKRIFFLFPLLLIFSTFIHAEDMTVIFAEHFDGWTKLNSEGMSASYKYGSDTKLDWSEEANPRPELVLSSNKEDATFTLTLHVYNGAHGTFNLTYQYTGNKPAYIYRDASDDNHLLNKKNPSLSFDVAEGTKQVKLIFKGPTKGTCYLRGIEISAPTSSIKTIPSPDLEFDRTEASVYLGKKTDYPILANPNHLQNLKWWSIDQSIATVDNNGIVIPKHVGSTQIFAIFQGDDNYAYQQVSYKLTVNRKAPENEVYYQGFEKYLSCGGNVDFALPFYMPDINSDQQGCFWEGYQCICVVDNYTVKALSQLGLKNCRLNFMLAPSLDPDYKAQVTAKAYLSNGSTLKSQIFTPEQGKWSSFSIPLTSEQPIDKVEFSGSYFFLDEISLVSEDVVTIGNTGYATLYYSDRTLKVPEGVTAYTMKIQNNEIVPSQTYNSGETLPKATAVVLKAVQGTYNLARSAETGVSDPNNQLKGSDTTTLIQGNASDTYYLLSRDGDNVGFFWGADNGAQFTNGAHKAYLALPATDGKQATAKPFYLFDKANTTTWIRRMAGDNDSPCYTLDGRLASRTFKGIIIKDGEKLLKK